MSPKSLIASTIIVTCLMSIATSAMAEERFSVDAWGQSFKTAVKANDSKNLVSLLDMKVLEKTALACLDCSNKEKLEKARELFAKKQFDASLALYNQIPKGTDYWFQAVEEKGWSYYRQNDSEKAIAQSKTLLSPQFAEVVNPESYFLQSLSQLKICDYKGIFATNQMFKEKQRARIIDVQNLTKTGMNNAFSNVIAKTNLLPLQAKDLGDSFLHLPILYYKDMTLQSELLRYKVTQKALEILKSENSTMVKLQGSLERMNQDAMSKLKARMAMLAQQETEDTKKIVQKLNLVEVEAIQRMHADMALNDAAYKKGKFKETNDDQLVFMDDGRPWIDELDKFEVSAKACPQDIRRKM